MKLQDNTGQKWGAKVDSGGKLATRSVTSLELTEAAGKGDGFLITTGFVTFTNAAESAFLYFKNDENRDLVFSRMIINTRTSTGATVNHATATIYSNVLGMTSGTGQPAAANNLRFGSSNTLAGTSEVGLTGAALTNGDAFGGFVIPLESLTSEITNITLPKGASIGVTITPPAGNSSFSVGVGINAHLAADV